MTSQQICSSHRALSPLCLSTLIKFCLRTKSAEGHHFWIKRTFSCREKPFLLHSYMIWYDSVLPFVLFEFMFTGQHFFYFSMCGMHDICRNPSWREHFKRCQIDRTLEWIKYHDVSCVVRFSQLTNFRTSWQLNLLVMMMVCSPLHSITLPRFPVVFTLIISPDMPTIFHKFDMSTLVWVSVLFLFFFYLH